MKIVLSKAGSGTLPLLFGVPDSWVGKQPTQTRLPEVFKPELKKLWVKSLVGLPDVNPEERWFVAIERFLSLCAEKNYDPFVPSNATQAGNAWVAALLMTTRHYLVKYLNSTHLLDLLDQREQKTAVKIVPLGFTITSTVRGLYEGGQLALARLLSSNVFGLHPAVSDRGQMFSKALWPNLWFYVLILSPSRMEVGYRITVNHSVLIPNAESMNRTAIKNWIISRLWLPSVRVTRIQNVSLRTRNF